MVKELKKKDANLKIRRRRKMDLTTAGKVEQMPLKEVRLTLDMGGFIYTGWFVVYDLVKYDMILGKNWMEEIAHSADLKNNVLLLGQDSKGNFLNQLEGLPNCKKEYEEKEMLDTEVSPIQAKEDSSWSISYEVAEVVDEETYQEDCAEAWHEVFGDEVELHAIDITKIPEFERKIKEQYKTIFEEPMGLPPVRKDGGFRIRTIPGIEPPHKSPYRQTPAEWEVYKEKIATLMKKRLI